MSLRADGAEAPATRRATPPVRRRSLPDKGGRARILDVNSVRTIASRALVECRDGVATERWRLEIVAIDWSARFSREALRLFQDLQVRLGLSTTRPILLPVNNQPFWHPPVAKDVCYWTAASTDRQRTKIGIGPQRLGRECRVGPGNFTLSLSQIPDLILSHHPARAIAPRLPPSVEMSGSSRFDPVAPTQRR